MVIFVNYKEIDGGQELQLIFYSKKLEGHKLSKICTKSSSLLLNYLYMCNTYVPDFRSIVAFILENTQPIDLLKQLVIKA